VLTVIESKSKIHFKEEIKMKKSMFGLVACLALVLSLVVVQGSWAGSCNSTITGSITEIINDNTISVDGQVINGVALSYLAKKYSIFLQKGDSVVITATPCPTDAEKLSACTIYTEYYDGVIIFPGTRNR
jgi:hypothetical protein